MFRILAIDDDADILEGIRQYFEPRGYTVLPASNATDALGIIRATTLDAVILDVLLPDDSGIDLCARVRENTQLPIVFISALGAPQDRISGLLAGGDDYLPKPYSLEELELRVRRRIECRRAEYRFETYRSGRLTVDTASRCVDYGGRTAELTALEFDLLAFLVAHPNQVFSYEQLYDRVWQMPILKSKHNIQVCMARLRQKINELSDGTPLIRTVYRKGYTFVPEEKA